MNNRFMLRVTHKVLLVTAGVVGVVAMAPPAWADKDPALQRAQDSINGDKKPKGAVRTDGEHGRVSVETKSGIGVYGEAGGKPPSHDNPKGEKKVGAGVQLRFGGSDGKKKD